jgi:multimeric flavodoxin WrbA
MKIIAINGSSRKDGNTARILGILEQQLRETAALRGVELVYEYIPLRDKNIGLCGGCRVCFDAGEHKCPLKDDLLEIDRKMTEADCVITASPVYVEDVTGLMKNFIDRMAFHCHRPAFAGKTAVILTTSGSGSTNHTLGTMDRALGLWGFKVMARQKFRMGALMDIGTAARMHKPGVTKLSRSITAAADKTALKPSLYALTVFRVQQRVWRNSEETGSYDYEYWSDNGWLDEKRCFYDDCKTSLVKRSIARLAGRLIARLMT